MPTFSKQFMVVSSLMLFMVLTRFHHFGSALSLPDASLAIFFLAGLTVINPWYFAVLMIEAGVIDYVAINQLSVSDYCVSPAYLFLLPTYGVMWLAGKFAQQFLDLSLVNALKAFGSAALASAIAFAISNGSFFGFSGRFNDMSWLEYFGRTNPFFLPYLTSTLIYSLCGLGLIKLWHSAKYLSTIKTNHLD